jgi:hypothetical protein
MAAHSLKIQQTGSAHLFLMVVVVLIIIGGIGAYVATGGFKKDSNSSQNRHQTSAGDNFTVTKASTAADIKAMLAAAKAGDYDVQCTVDYDKVPEASNALLPVSGKSTLYISGTARMRVDTTINHKPGHFMRLGKSVYLWADGAKQGSKIPVSTKSSSSSSSTDTFTKDAEKYDMQCQSVARLDDSLFVLPTGVTFTDLNSQFNSSSN